jgi:hypothetical protein
MSDSTSSGPGPNCEIDVMGIISCGSNCHNGSTSANAEVDDCIQTDWRNTQMQASLYSNWLAFAAFSGFLAITPVAAHTSAVVHHSREKATRSKPRTQAVRAPLREMPRCAPDDRKCEVERKLKGQVSDPRLLIPAPIKSSWRLRVGGQ